MPPRKPLSSRAPAARRGARGARASEGPPEEEGYQTGSDYPAADEELEPTPNGEDDLGDGPSPGEGTGRYREGEDLYGEDDPFPEEDEPSSGPERPKERRGGGFAPAEATRAGPSDEEDEDSADDENATRAGPPVHLEVVSGPDQGRKKRFRGVRMVIGRTPGCDFKLSDGSVSRRHLELVLGDDGVLLRDLGSGNGTRVNGEKAAERLLEDGDEIAIGKTRFRFVDEQASRKAQQAAAEAAEAAAREEEAAEQASPVAPDGQEVPQFEVTQPRAKIPGRSPRRLALAPSPRTKRALAIGLSALAVAAAAGFALIDRGPPPPPPEDPRVAKAELSLQQGRAALADRRFPEAVALLEEADRLAPGGSLATLEGARKELSTHLALEEVRALLAQGEFEQARLDLAKVPLAVVLGEEARRAVEVELDAAEVAATRELAEAALEQGALEEAASLIARLPRSMAQALKPRLSALQGEAAVRQAEQARVQKVRATERQKQADSARQGRVDEAFAAVERRFHAGEYSRAALECDRVVEQHKGDKEIRERAALLKRLIPQFGRAVAEGQKKVSARNLEGAAPSLRRARELWAQLGFAGPLGQTIDDQLAQASLAAATAALSRRDLASASRHYKQALELAPGEPSARAGLDQVYRRAEDLYLQAYIIRDRDPRQAAESFRVVMDVLPRTSPTWERAQTQLSNLSP